MLRLSHTFPSLIILTTLMVNVALAQPVERDRDRGRPGSPVLTVSGEGKASATPDRATVRVGAVAQAKDASEAQAKVNEIVTKTIDAIKALGIDAKAIQTSGVSLYPVYSNERPVEPLRDGNNEPKITGYRAQNGVVVRVDDLAKLGPVIDAAVASGGNSIDGVSFELKDDAPQRKEALKQAAAEAKAKAEAIAEAMGLELMGVQEVAEGGLNVAYPMMMGRGAMMAASAESTPIEAGQVETSASLTVTYRVREPGKGEADEQRKTDDR